MKIFHKAICPDCQQGRLFLMKKVKTSEVFLHCEECEACFFSNDMCDNVNYFDDQFIEVEASLEEAKSSYFYEDLMFAHDQS
jgi:uncharacterized protein (DUF983 family)